MFTLIVLGIWNSEEGSPPRASPLQEPRPPREAPNELLESASKWDLISSWQIYGIVRIA